MPAVPFKSQKVRTLGVLIDLYKNLFGSS